MAKPGSVKPSKLHRSFGRAWRRTGVFFGTEIKGSSRYATATEKRARRFGKQFIDSFSDRVLRGVKRKRFVISLQPVGLECANSITIEHQDITRVTKAVADLKQPHAGIARLGLGFERKAIIVEMIQGKKGMLTAFDQFRQSPDNPKQMPWADFLLKKVENHAIKHGFTSVKIRIPQTTYYYWNPMISTAGKTREQIKKEKREIQEIMEKRYKLIANDNGYEIKGKFFVKEL